MIFRQTGTALCPSLITTTPFGHWLDPATTTMLTVRCAIVDALPIPDHMADTPHRVVSAVLQVGNVGLSFVEQRSHFAMWSLLTSPMLIGTNLKTASKATMSILTAAEVVSVNQDSLSVQGRRLASTQAGAWLKETDPYTPVPSGTLEVWGKPLSDGSVAVILLNRGDVAAPITVQFSDLPWLKATTGCKVRDLWARKDLGSASQSYTSGPIESHDNAMLKITCGTLTSADSTV